ncbi:MAG: cytochrome c oxidase subunit II [Proteobacteria bacterium]|nr:cytochrome c oxidase subunit II [Pseudomonadota bacterium]
MTIGRSSARAFAVFAAPAAFLLSTPAFADLGRPAPWQLGFQEAASPIMRQIDDFHNFLLVLSGLITFFVLGLLIYVALRFNSRANPTPSKTSHHTLIEVAWSVVPILILVVVAIPSFRLLFAQYDFPKADLTVKAIGSQWYWSYEYPDHGDLTFDAVLLEDDELKPGQPRLLATDNDVVVPVNRNIHILVTATDVLHSWAVPAFGVKTDAVPGRIVRTWFRAEKTGVYYGQCSELCGQKHAYMPIAVRVVSDADFEIWLKQAKQDFASAPSRRAKLRRSAELTRAPGHGR